MENSIIFIGMDVHKNSISIALASPTELLYYGQIDGSMEALDKVVRKLVSKGNRLRFVYEAGPCGYQIYRHLTAKGFDCTVAAPSKISKNGSRIKNDRRDAMTLARLHRSGDLIGVYVPKAEDEAMRDLTRARENAMIDEKRSKQRLLGFLLHSGYRYSGRSTWSQAHRRWMADIKMPHQSQQIVLQEYIDTVTQCSQRVERLKEQIRQLLPQWELFPVVKAIQSLRGISLIVAATTVAEIVDFKRFKNPVQLMGYLGLIPSEHSSGTVIRRGPITKAGNSHVRRMLVESAWSYRLRARVSRILLKRQEELPESIRDISWKAQVRLCSRFRYLRAKGKPQQVVAIAIARELCGFIWAIVMEHLGLAYELATLDQIHYIEG